MHKIKQIRLPTNDVRIVKQDDILLASSSSSSFSLHLFVNHAGFAIHINGVHVVLLQMKMRKMMMMIQKVSKRLSKRNVSIRW